MSRDKVQRSIRREANEAVEYLQKREAFWEILELGKDDAASIKALESFRALM